MRAKILIGASLLLCSSMAFADRVFYSGFEALPSSINCPGATSMDVFENGLGGSFYRMIDSIDPAGDVDYFTFTREEAGWVNVSAYGLPPPFPPLTDTWIGLYTGDGATRLASNNDGVGVTSITDSVLIFRMVTPGTYCLEVQDYSTVSGTTAKGGPDFQYALDVIPIDFTLYDAFNEDAGGNDSTASAQTNISAIVNENFQKSTWILGVVDSDSDIDVYKVVTPTSAKGMSIRFTPDGNAGYGGTVPLNIIKVIGPDASTTISSTDYRKNGESISLPVNEDTEYYLFVDTTAPPLGDNPFYALQWLTFDAINPQESNDAGNDLPGGAEVATGFNGSHFIGGTLGGSGDTDWWSFQATAGQAVSVFCGSLREGSGVLNMLVSLFENPVNLALQSETESETVDLAWTSNSGASMPAVPVTVTGTHYLSISASTFSPEVTGRYYQCGIHVF